MKFLHLSILIVVLTISNNVVSQTNMFGYEGDAYFMMEVPPIQIKNDFGFGISNQFEFKTRKVFSFLGGITTDFQFLKNTETFGFESSTTKIKINDATIQRISFPLTFRFNFCKKLKFFSETSFIPIVSLLYGNFKLSEYQGHGSGWSSYYEEKSVTRGQIGGSSGLGIRYPFGKRIEFVIKTDIVLFGSDISGINLLWNLHLGFNYHYKKDFKPKQN